jgi:hypothetical protein
MKKRNDTLLPCSLPPGSGISGCAAVDDLFGRLFITRTPLVARAPDRADIMVEECVDAATDRLVGRRIVRDDDPVSHACWLRKWARHFSRRSA